MKREHIAYFAIPATIALLFWDARVAGFAILVETAWLIQARGVLRLVWRALSRLRTGSAPPAADTASAPEAEPTLITLVARAPNQLLGIDQDAGTSTIFHSFHRQMKEEQLAGPRLNKKGRRLSAAKNAMLSRRRKRGRPADPAKAQSQLALEKSLGELLEDRPIFSGKAVRFLNLSASAAEEYQVGAEIEDVGRTATCATSPGGKAGRGSSCFTINSRSGRLLSDSADGQVVFPPGTRFLIVSRQPWRNPNFPDSPPGFAFELEELTDADETSHASAS